MGRSKKYTGVVNGGCKYWGEIRRGFEMTKLTYFDRYNVILHQEDDRLNTVFFDCLRLLPSTEYCSAPLDERCLRLQAGESAFLGVNPAFLVVLSPQHFL